MSWLAVFAVSGNSIAATVGLGRHGLWFDFRRMNRRL
jgi:hypothetical protein